MKNIGYLLLVSYLVFAGVDRINFGGNSIESFKLLPHIPLSLLIISFIALFKISDINFNWISNKKSVLICLSSFIIFVLISILFSMDIFYSFKRFILLLLIIFTIISILSAFTKEEIKKYLYHASIFGSLLFYVFNILLFLNWLGYLDISSNIINLNPDYIAYFIPRLGGFTLDVNRGIAILIIYTFFLLSYSNKKSILIQFIIILNILFIFASLSRTAIVFFLITIFLYAIFYSTRREKIAVFVFIPISFILLFNILSFYSQNDIIDIESALEERLTLDDFGHDTSTGIHLKLIDEGFRIAFSDLKIFFLGCGHGASYKIIKGFHMSGKKIANFHSQYLSILVENGFFASISFLILSIIIPLFYIRGKLLPIMIGLFCFNLLYQLTNEPLYWFTILYYYKFNDYA